MLQFDLFFPSELFQCTIVFAIFWYVDCLGTTLAYGALGGLLDYYTEKPHENASNRLLGHYARG